MLISFGRKKSRPAEPIEPKISAAPLSPPQHSAKKLPDLFNGLTEKQINHIYTNATIKRLKPEETLFRVGEERPALHIVLEGCMEVTVDKSGYAFLAETGSIIGVKEFIEGIPNAASARADIPSVVMTIDKGTAALLDSDVRDFFYEHIIKTHVRRSTLLENQNRQLSFKVSALAKRFYSARTSAIYDYSQSDLILNVIKRIPKLPAYTHTLSTKLLDENVSTNEITSLIKQDPALAADVLKSVNSSYYGLEQKVSDINSAVLLLGYQSLYQLVVSEGVRRTMPDTPDFKEIHNHALALSSFSFSLSMTTKVGVPVQMSTIGLLHNMGESIVSLLRQKNPNMSVFLDFLDRPSLGAYLLDGWNFPAIISQSVRFQNFPEFADPSMVPDQVLRHIAILYISQLCYRLMQGMPEEELPLVYFSEYKQILNLDELTLEEILRKKVLPDLRKRNDGLPLFLKEMIKQW